VIPRPGDYLVFGEGRQATGVPGNAVLMAAAPALYELLEEVTEQAEFYLLMLRSEHPGMAASAPLAARKLLAEIRCGLL
jgi:hypothetical protein